MLDTARDNSNATDTDVTASYVTVAAAARATGLGVRRVYRLLESGRVEGRHDAVGRLVVQVAAVMAVVRGGRSPAPIGAPAPGPAADDELDWPTFRDGITSVLARLIRRNAQLEARMSALEQLIAAGAVTTMPAATENIDAPPR